MRHVPLFGPLRVPESFLAVDLFYLVSGFVVAHAYAQRLAAGGYFWDFVKVRLIRLYPLYLAGLAAGVLMVAASILQSPHSTWTPVKVAECVALGLLMIPRFPGLTINGTTLDGPLWTLLYELVANFVYAAAIKLMRAWVLVAIMLVSGVEHLGRAGLQDPRRRLQPRRPVGGARPRRLFVLRRRPHLPAVRARRAEGAVGFCFALSSPCWAWALLATSRAADRPLRDRDGARRHACHRDRGRPLRARSDDRADVQLDRAQRRTEIYCPHQPLGNLVVMEIGRYVPRGLGGAVVGVLFTAAVVLLCWLLDLYYDAPLRRWRQR